MKLQGKKISTEEGADSKMDVVPQYRYSTLDMFMRELLPWYIFLNKLIWTLFSLHMVNIKLIFQTENCHSQILKYNL